MSLYLSRYVCNSNFFWGVGGGYIQRLFPAKLHYCRLYYCTKFCLLYIPLNKKFSSAKIQRFVLILHKIQFTLLKKALRIVTKKWVYIKLWTSPQATVQSTFYRYIHITLYQSPKQEVIVFAIDKSIQCTRVQSQ